MSQLRLRCKKNFLEVNQGQDQKLGIRVVIPILCIKQDGTRSFIKIMLYKVYLLFKTSFFIFSPIFLGWMLDVLKEFKVQCLKIFGLWLNSFRVIMIWKITCLIKNFVFNLLYIWSCSLSVPSSVVLWTFIIHYKLRPSWKCNIICVAFEVILAP